MKANPEKPEESQVAGIPVSHWDMPSEECADLRQAARWAWTCIVKTADLFCQIHCVPECSHKKQGNATAKDWTTAQRDLHEAFAHLSWPDDLDMECPACAVVKALAHFPWLAQRSPVPPVFARATYYGDLANELPPFAEGLDSVPCWICVACVDIDELVTETLRADALCALDMNNLPPMPPWELEKPKQLLSAGQAVAKYVECQTRDAGPEWEEYLQKAQPETDKAEEASGPQCGTAEQGREAKNKRDAPEKAESVTPRVAQWRRAAELTDQFRQKLVDFAEWTAGDSWAKAAPSAMPPPDGDAKLLAGYLRELGLGPDAEQLLAENGDMGNSWMRFWLDRDSAGAAGQEGASGPNRDVPPSEDQAAQDRRLIIAGEAKMLADRLAKLLPHLWEGAGSPDTEGPEKRGKNREGNAPPTLSDYVDPEHPIYERAIAKWHRKEFEAPSLAGEQLTPERLAERFPDVLEGSRLPLALVEAMGARLHEYRGAVEETPTPSGRWHDLAGYIKHLRKCLESGRYGDLSSCPPDLPEVLSPRPGAGDSEGYDEFLKAEGQLFDGDEEAAAQYGRALARIGKAMRSERSVLPPAPIALAAWRGVLEKAKAELLRHQGFVRVTPSQIVGLRAAFTKRATLDPAIIEKLEKAERRIASGNQAEAMQGVEACLSIAQKIARSESGRRLTLAEIEEQAVKASAHRGNIILLTGEPGTGKSYFAKSLHDKVRKGKPFITLDCSTITRDIFESKVFGHVKGAFTGATNDKPGAVAEAQGGTLFIDEIGDISIAHQQKFRRLLQDRLYQRMGLAKDLSAECYFIVATNKPLETMVGNDEFAKDLWQRIKGFSYCMPSLCDHKDGIPDIIGSIVTKLNNEAGRRLYEVSIPERKLVAVDEYDWPEHIRGLEQAVRKACTLAASSDRRKITAEMILDAARQR